MEVRFNLREGDSPQISLFSAADMAAIQQEHKGVGCKMNRERAEGVIVEFLRGRAHALPDPMFNIVMQDVPIRRTQLNKLVMDMRSRGVVQFELPARKRVPQPATRISILHNLGSNK